MNNSTGLITFVFVLSIVVIISLCTGKSVKTSNIRLSEDETIYLIRSVLIKKYFKFLKRNLIARSTN